MADEVPPHLREAARDALEELHALIQSRGQATAAAHAEAFEQYRSELQVAFAAASYLPEPKPFDPTQPPPTIQRQWDPLKFRSQGSEALQSFAALIDTLQAVDTEEFQATLDEAADDGFINQLWMLELSGIDTGSLADYAPEDWGAIVRDAAYEEEDWEDRLDTWGRTTKSKMLRLLTALGLSGALWADTADGYDRIAQQHTQRVTGLLGNEIFRAFAIGGMVGLGLAERQLGLSIPSIWMCRTLPDGRLDAAVCPICAPLHMKVTNARPVDDTHPGCRCIKVPVPEGYAPTVVPSPNAVEES